MSKNTVLELSGQGAVDSLTELLRVGAERLIYRAVEAELQELRKEVRRLREEVAELRHLLKEKND